VVSDEPTEFASSETAGQRGEDVSRETDEKFRIAFENAPTGMSIIRPDGRFLSVNPTLCRMFGYSKEELLEGTFNAITHPDDIERGNRWVRKMMAGDYSEPEFEKRYIHKDGHVVWGLVRAQWLRNEDGAPRMSVVHILDITERKRAEQEVLARERQLREAHEIAQMGHFQIDLANLSMSWTDGIYRLLEFELGGVSPSQELFLSRVHPDDRGMVEGAHQAVVERNLPCDLVHRLLFPGDRVKYVRKICRSEPDDAGRALRITGILQDVTLTRKAEEDRVQLEAQLHHAQKMEAIGYLAGGIAHDFNNLLTAIGGNAALATIGKQGDENLSVYLSEIVKAVNSAAELTRQLLTFSRKQVTAPRILNLNAVINHLALMLRRLLGEDLELKTVLGTGLGQVQIDLGQVEQILINLAVNARDATQDGGKLTIETANTELDQDFCRRHEQLVPGPFVRLTVSDTGCGMSEETKQHLYEPFFTTKEQGRGTGLGLAMVYGAVRQNQGHIEVQSELGQGTTFRIYLPRVDAPPEAIKVKVDAISDTGDETILLVEDDDMVRSLAARGLLRKGYRVLSYPNAREALEAIGAMQEPIDLVITDVVMPGMNGRVFAEKVRRLRPEIKVLYTSGYAQDVIVHHGVPETSTQFLAKPYSPELLARRVRESLG
jgi:two-component system, cell cycle sensor histidine kinase and response regulator CckA